VPSGERSDASENDELDGRTRYLQQNGHHFSLEKRELDEPDERCTDEREAGRQCQHKRAERPLEEPTTTALSWVVCQSCTDEKPRGEAGDDDLGWAASDVEDDASPDGDGDSDSRRTGVDRQPVQNRRHRQKDQQADQYETEYQYKCESSTQCLPEPESTHTRPLVSIDVNVLIRAPGGLHAIGTPDLATDGNGFERNPRIALHFCEPARTSTVMEELLSHGSTGMLVCDAEWRVVDSRGPVDSLLGASADSTERDIQNETLEDVLPDGLATRITEQAGSDGPVTVEEYLPAIQQWVEIRTVAVDERTLLEIRDVTEWAERVTELETARRNIDLLHRHVELISELLGAVVTATTAEEIQTAVITQLADTNLFELALIGDWNATRDGLAVRAAAGNEALLAAIRTADSVTAEQRARESGETQVLRELAKNEMVPGPVRKAAFADGIQAGIVVPLTDGSTTFGVLGLYTARPETLTDPGVAGIETLGAVVGFVLSATRQRQALDTATRRELALAVGPEGGALARLAYRSECPLTLEGTANVGSDVVLAYVTVDGVDAETVGEIARTDADIEQARVVENTDDGGLCELRLSGGALLVQLVGLGATIQSATIGPDGGDVTVDVSPQTDVRSFLDTLTAVVSDLELRATQTRERPARTTAAVENVLDEELTERQRTALKTAYEAGYFASPRHSTAEEVAEALGVTSPTFSHHLRVAQEKLLAACFEN
jgi:predicted DNA binding protein